jgi:predicted amidophosphoribosyltransferase
MLCPRCGVDNSEGGKFCIECATPLPRRCPNCGAMAVLQAQFCGQCATPLTAENRSPTANIQSPAPKQDVAERRQLMVMLGSPFQSTTQLKA